MFRLKITYRNGSPRPIIELGPWHPVRKNAEDWAETLRALGYAVQIESQRGGIVEEDDNSDLAAALAGMA